MKSKLFITAIVFFLTTSIVFAQTIESKTTTAKLPEGTYVEAGKLKAKKGYKFVMSSDGKSATIQTVSKPKTTGTFTCACSQGTNGDCGVLYFR